MRVTISVIAPEGEQSREVSDMIAVLASRWGRRAVHLLSGTLDAATFSRSNVLVAILGPEHLAALQKPRNEAGSDAPASELARQALTQAFQRHMLVAPVLVSGAVMPDAATLPPELQPLAYTQSLMLHGNAVQLAAKLQRQITAQLVLPAQQLWVLKGCGLALLWDLLCAALAFLTLALASQQIIAYIQYNHLTLSSPLSGFYGIAILVLGWPWALLAVLAAIQAARDRLVSRLILLDIASACIVATLIAITRAVPDLDAMQRLIQRQNVQSLLPGLAASLAVFVAVLLGGLLLVAYGLSASRIVTDPLNATNKANKSNKANKAAEKTTHPLTFACFISYRRSDSRAICERIYNHLQQESALMGGIYLDVDIMLAGADFPDVIARALAGSHVVLILIGPTWLTAATSNGLRRLDDPADYVRLEIATALSSDKIIIPVLIEDAAMPTAHDLPADIAGLAAYAPARVRSGASFQRDMRLLTRRILRAFSPAPTPFPWLVNGMIAALGVLVAVQVWNIADIWRYAYHLTGECDLLASTSGWCAGSYHLASIRLVSLVALAQLAIIVAASLIGIFSAIHLRRWRWIWRFLAPLLALALGIALLVAPPFRGQPVALLLWQAGLFLSIAALGAVMFVLIAFQQGHARLRLEPRTQLQTS